MEGKTDRRLPAEERIKSKKAIAQLFEQGRSGLVYPVRYVFLPEEAAAKNRAEAPGQLLVSVSKRNHKRAVVRNCLKRRLREAYRNNKSLLGGAADRTFMLGLLYISNEQADYARIEAAVTKIMRTLSKTA
ncbi:ribonuclease P protein component [uncultured Alistipes sp.]|uniref:ribonuclease P protein component n=1 Tax=uncultured Alistipes sp. TaxID=538949 RepID=UPI00262F48C5|nr:ribonuclease P protein component [uncultured Alistipes sp.]